VLLLSWMLLVGLKAPSETRRSEHVVPKSGRVERSSRSERSLPRTRSGVETSTTLRLRPSRAYACP